MVVSSEEVTKKIMAKLTKLKLLDPIEEHTRESIKILIEETIDVNFEKIRPRTINWAPTIKIDDSARIKVRGDGGFHGKKNKFKFHMMELGDELFVSEKYQLQVHNSLNYFIKTYKPNWYFEKTDDGYGEYKFKRLK